MAVQVTYYVHGTTFDNEDGIATGWLPGELSSLGIEQSHSLAREVADKHFDVVICSDLKRAVDTAETAFGKKHIVIRDARLREANYGDWNGKSHNLFKSDMTKFIESAFPNGESYKDVEIRMRSLAEELLKKYDGKQVALLAHQAPQLALEVIARGKTWEEAITEDWRLAGKYQPGWKYVIK